MSENFKSELVQFLKSVGEASNVLIEDDTPLIESGILDSLNIVSLLDYIRENTCHKVTLEELDLENVQSVEKIVEVYGVTEEVVG